MNYKRAILYLVLIGCAGVVVFAQFQRTKQGAQEGEKPASPAPTAGRHRELRDFRMPSVSPAGTTEWVASGKRAIQLDAQNFKIFQFALDMFIGVNPNTGEQQKLRLTSDTARLDRRSKRAWLHENVVVHFDKHTVLRTTKLSYNPADNSLETNEHVSLVSKGARVDGRGLLVSIPRGEATLKQDVRVVLSNVRALLQGAFGRSASASAGPAGPPVHITCAGRLVIQRLTNCATFYDEVLAKQGDAVLRADELSVYFDPKSHRVARVSAGDHVELCQGENTARGSKLHWDAQNQLLSLDGAPMVVIETKEITLRCNQAIYHQNEQEFTSEGGGYLVTRPRKTGDKPESPVEVVWKGFLSFKRGERRVQFTDNVKVVRGDGTLQCDRLTLWLEDKPARLRRAEASGGVTLIQGKRTARGERLKYDAAAGAADMWGAPFVVLTEPGRVLRSAQIRFFEKNRRAEGRGAGDLKVAANARPGRADEGPATVAWRKSMLFDPNAKRAVFKGEVAAQRGDAKIRADEVAAAFDDNNELKAVTARKQVVVVSAGRRAEGDEFHWVMKDGQIDLEGEPHAVLTQQGYRIACRRFHMQEDRGLLRGEGKGKLKTLPRPGDRRPPIRISWEKHMVFDRQKRQAEFIGRVLVNRGSAALRAQRLIMHLTPDNRMNAVDAIGGVVIQDGKRTGQGDRLHWDYDTNEAVLLPKPGELVRVLEPGLVLTGIKAFYNSKEGRFRLISRETGKPEVTAKPAGRKPPAASGASPKKPASSGEQGPATPSKPSKRPELKFFIPK